jgi:isobutyryl-CoA mutase
MALRRTMATMYQRGKIQEESMYYEQKKHDGSLPLIGVNTYLPQVYLPGTSSRPSNSSARRPTRPASRSIAPIRSVSYAMRGLVSQSGAQKATPGSAAALQHTARARENLFAALMDAVKNKLVGAD